MVVVVVVIVNGNFFLLGFFIFFMLLFLSFLMLLLVILFLIMLFLLFVCSFIEDDVVLLVLLLISDYMVFYGYVVDEFVMVLWYNFDFFKYMDIFFNGEFFDLLIMEDFYEDIDIFLWSFCWLSFMVFLVGMIE